MEKYYALRDQIKTGDAILWNGAGLISSAIRRWSKFSHVSLVVRMPDYDRLKERVFMVEALNHGLEFTLLSNQLEGYSGQAHWMSVGMTTEQQSLSRAHALLECASTTGYDYKSLFRNVLGRVSMDARHYFCSEFVWFNYIYAGRVEATKKAPRPGDLVDWVSDPLACEPVQIYP